MDVWMEESSSDEDFVDSDTEEERRRADQMVADTDHWLIQKLIRYIKVGFASISQRFVQRPCLTTAHTTTLQSAVLMKCFFTEPHR